MFLHYMNLVIDKSMKLFLFIGIVELLVQTKGVDVLCDANKEKELHRFVNDKVHCLS